MQRVFSCSWRHEKGVVGGGDFRSGKESEGEMQVAILKASTSFRMKKRGKVPPRFDALPRGWSGFKLAIVIWGTRTTYVAKSVMYVPPITGSAILA